MSQVISDVSVANLKLAAPMALLVHDNTALETARQAIGKHLGLWIASEPRYDVAGALWSLQGRLVSRERPEAPAPGQYLGIASQVPCLLDGVYGDWGEEYLDICHLRAEMTENENEVGSQP